MATLQVSVSLLRRVAPILGGGGGEMPTVPGEVLKNGTSWVDSRTGVLSFLYGCVPRAESRRHVASARRGGPTHPNSQVIVGALEVAVTFGEAGRLPASAGCRGRAWCPLWGHVLVL